MVVFILKKDFIKLLPFGPSKPGCPSLPGGPLGPTGPVEKNLTHFITKGFWYITF